uniref:Disintegrin and metalloproteinase domain-containing protein 12-like n=1 Tax=Gouania willdenowi TaxID=441366 RepID=A0A8C5GWH4_GOUWI
HPNSDVTLSTCSGLRGFISLENKTFIIEPVPSNDAGAHFIYRAEELRLTPGACGHGFNMSSVAPESHIKTPIVCFQKHGKDLEKVKQRLAEIANYVDKFYRALNIRVALVGLEVWSDSDKCPITQDPFTTLHEFLDWRKVKLLPTKPHDNAQLISGVYFQGTTIGMAPIMSMCTAEQSGGIVMDHSENPLGAAVTLAHELGHNFGMNHDTPERGCGCRMTADRGGCIMTPSTGYPFPTIFSTCSKKDLAASLEKGVGMCLYNMPEVKVLYGGQKCGNGYVEEGEECDCGEPEECMNPCCNATTCTLKGDAVCAHGQCCEDCRLKVAGTMCREPSNSCDLPEFCTGASPHCPANVYLHDGHACHHVEGYCYNGICQTHEQQCITLWGPGAKPAPGICFERVNSAGDPYGNCGKDSKGSFAKCDAKDAKCGKIQCQGGANRPVIGTNAVSIETNIPQQEGGRILCRGTHVYLGDDMPDPGLVLAGTRCDDGMVCLNRQCQNVTIFGVYECSGKCNRRGVCNNKKNCHCEANWAPPTLNKHVKSINEPRNVNFFLLTRPSCNSLHYVLSLYCRCACVCINVRVVICGISRQCAHYCGNPGYPGHPAHSHRHRLCEEEDSAASHVPQQEGHAGQIQVLRPFHVKAWSLLCCIRLIRIIKICSLKSRLVETERQGPDIISPRLH